MHTILDDFLELLAPNHCPACHLPYPKARSEPNPFCLACAPLIDAVDVAHRPPNRDSSLWVYAGPVRDALIRIKYEGRPGLLQPVLAAAAQGAAPFAGRIDFVIPVPLHPRRVRERGFDFPALTARAVGRKLGVKVLPRALERTRDTPPQKGLGPKGRADNIRGAFRVNPPSHLRLRGARVLLVDDVRTTGATFHGCTRPLVKAGAAVSAFSIARAYGGEDPHLRAQTPT